METLLTFFIHYKEFIMSVTPRYLDIIANSFELLSKEAQEDTMERIKLVNGVDKDADITKNVAPFILQDMLLSLVDDAFKADHVLSELQEDGVSDDFIKQHNLNEEQVIAFRNGAYFAIKLYREIVMESPTLVSLMAVMQEVQQSPE